MIELPVIKRVYQRQVPNNLPEQPKQPQQHTSILEELEAIDRAIDQQINPNFNEASSSSSSQSIQPSLSLGQNNEPPSSSLPLTPNDLPSPIHSIKPIPHLQQTLDQVSNASIQKSESASSPTDQRQHIPIKRSKPTRRVLDSDDDDLQVDPTEQSKPKTKKFKKLKGLTKKEKEEAQRVIAACERQKNFRLVASCRAPLTRLGDIINKATRTMETNSKQSDRPTFDALAIESNRKIDEHHQPNPIHDLTDKDDNDELPTIDQLEAPSNPPIFPSLSKYQNKTNTPQQEEALKKKEWLKNQRNALNEPGPSANQQEPVEMIDSDSDLEVVPAQNSHSTTRDPLTIVSTDLLAQRLSRNRSHSKSITSQPSLSKKMVPESLPIPFFPTSSKSIKKSYEKTLDKPKDHDLMQSLLAKSAIERALIREQKQNEFIERGGRLAKEIQSATSVEVQQVDLKSILKNNNHASSKSNSNVEEEDEEEDIECDWDEVASSAEGIELSGEDEVERAEGNEDEIEDSHEEEVDDDADEEDSEDVNAMNDTTLKPAEGPNDLETPRLPKPSPNRRQLAISIPLQTDPKNLSSESSSNSITQPVGPAHYPDYKSTILASDSNNADQNSSRTSSKPSVSDSSEINHQPINSPSSHSNSLSPIDLPGFNLDPQSKSIIQEPLPIGLSHCSRRSSSSSSSNGNSNSLPGFNLAKDSKIKSSGGSMVDGFSQNNASTILSKPHNEKNEHQIPQSGFSQFFTEGQEEDEGFHFSHPPPLLKSKIQNRENNDDHQDDFDAEIEATCILPAVAVLPEERDRDLVVMILGEQQTAMEDDDQPIEYVNHRGFLTQHKPLNEPNGPPDSPLMSQDPISRTPFALRKRNSLAVESESARQIEAEGVNSPLKLGVDARRESMDSEVHSPIPPIAESPKLMAENAFTKVMRAQQLKPPTSHPTDRLPSGKGKIFLADEADESEDEYDGFGRRLSGDEDEEGLGSETEEAKKMLKELVDDGEDDRDEKSKLEGDLALRNLAKQHLEQLDQKFSDQIHKIVNGKFRVQKARRNGAGGGAISDSDSEDDAEIETLAALKRAQAFAKKKKKAIDLLANKHESFFKSYQEGTSQWVDEDELTYLQQPEDQDDNRQESDYADSEDQIEKDEEGEDEESLDDMLEIGSKAHHEENEKTKWKAATISSSPPINSESRPLPFKINDRFSLLSSNTNPSKNPSHFNHRQKQQSSESNSNLHLDLDKMYDGLKSTKNSLTERQRRLVIEELGVGEGRGAEGDKSRGVINEGRKNSGSHNNINNNKSSSITYQQQQHRKFESMKAHSKLASNFAPPSGSDVSTTRDSTSTSRNRLSKLKKRK